MCEGEGLDLHGLHGHQVRGHLQHSQWRDALQQSPVATLVGGSLVRGTSAVQGLVTRGAGAALQGTTARLLWISCRWSE